MRHIVVGADGSRGSMDALRWAGNLAAEQDADVTVVTGSAPAEAEFHPFRHRTTTSPRAGGLDEWCRVAEVGSTPVHPVGVLDDPRHGILRVAARETADLIVVGRNSTSTGLGRLHIGSTAEWLVHHADRTVAVVGGAVRTPVRRAVVGVDGSAGSRAALAWVADLARRTGIEVVVASGADDPGAWSASPDPARRSAGVEDRIRTDWARPLTDRHVPFSVHTSERTNAADGLVQAARDERADIIVVGMRAISRYTGMRIGGVAVKVLHRADRTVVLVPPEHL